MTKPNWKVFRHADYRKNTGKYCEEYNRAKRLARYVHGHNGVTYWENRGETLTQRCDNTHAIIQRVNMVTGTTIVRINDPF